MKKIINGKMYNTETAAKVGFWSNDLTYGDFGWIEQTLYKKKTGEFFLFGEGGPATGYAERVCGGYCSGSRITPMTVEEAKQWAESRMNADDYEAVFGPVEE